MFLSTFSDFPFKFPSDFDFQKWKHFRSEWKISESDFFWNCFTFSEKKHCTGHIVVVGYGSVLLAEVSLQTENRWYQCNSIGFVRPSIYLPFFLFWSLNKFMPYFLKDDPDFLNNKKNARSLNLIREAGQNLWNSTDSLVAFSPSNSVFTFSQREKDIFSPPFGWYF